MCKYVKSDIVDSPFLTKGKSYKVVGGTIDNEMVVINCDDGSQAHVITEASPVLKCSFLKNMDTWKWCDKGGNLLKEK